MGGQSSPWGRGWVQVFCCCFMSEECDETRRYCRSLLLFCHTSNVSVTQELQSLYRVLGFYPIGFVSVCKGLQGATSTHLLVAEGR
jgi:hypothetical protein